MIRFHVFYNPFVTAANTLQPLVLLTLRLWIAVLFFKSGLVKIEDFSTAVALFADEYKVPFLPPYLAALSAVTFELSCPVLLALGLLTRLACLPLLAMTAIIQFTYLEHIQHAYWAMLLLVILTHGAGKWSLDHALSRRSRRAP